MSEMKRLLAVASVVTVAVVAVACGDGDADPTPPANGEVTRSVAMDDFAFQPDTVTVPAGSRVTLTVDNAGGFEHTWTLLDAGPSIDTVAELEPDRILVEVVVAEGGSETVTFTAPAAGLYQVVCNVIGHLELGMEGTLIVEG